MRTLVFGVIYPGVENYLEDYFNSIYNQTTNDFDLLIIEDGIELPDKFFKKRTIKKKSTNQSPAEIRKDGISFARDNGYDLIVFTDTDDFYSVDRVKNNVEKIPDSSFIANTIITVNNYGIKLGKIKIPSNINFRKILQQNYFGFTNTAINLKYLPDNFYIPEKIVAVDWWIYSLILLINENYVSDNKSISYYRQHSNSLVGYNKKTTSEEINRYINIKINHIKYLLEYLYEQDINYHIEYLSNQLNEYFELKKMLEDDDFSKKYIHVINNNIDRIKKGWWSEVITIDQFNNFSKR